MVTNRNQVVAGYTPTIGIETHVQLKTRTKLFAAVGNDARQAAPNSLISHICIGLPGALPVLNEAALELAARAAFALNTEPQAFSKFDRKHYFYPDLPKGYQISQYDQPIIIGGFVEVAVDGRATKIGITRANLEEDAGKNTHPAGADYSLVDLNRAGTPLLEIVSQPEIHSPAEAKAYVRELYLLMKYAGVTEGDLYHGNIRFDVNVSLSKDPDLLGTRSEVKNLNSFRSVESAIAFEIERQTELLENGGTVIQETRGWDEVKQQTTSQRGKEEAHDYRYMPEPDIPPIEMSADDIEKFRQRMPILPPAIRRRLLNLKVEPKVVEDLLDKPELIPAVLSLIDRTSPTNARGAVFRLMSLNTAQPIEINETAVAAEIAISEMVERGELSSSAAKQLSNEVLKTKEDPRSAAQKLNLLQVSDEAEIERIVEAVLNQNPQAAEAVKAGQAKAIGFLIGQVMAQSQGRANPGLAAQMIKKRLSQ